MATTVNIRYQIDDLTLDTRLGTLSRNGEEIALPQLSYRLLCELVDPAPAIISQDELMSRVWGDQVVSDETLKQRIKLLRQALGDTPQSPKYIESVRGRGYRCVAEVKKQVTRQKPTHDSINLRLSDRLPVAYLQASKEYWRLAGVFLLMTLLVFAVVLTINQLSPQRRGNASEQPQSSVSTTEQQAEQAYQKGRTFYLRYQSMDNEMAIKSFQKATRLNPNHALAFAGLADAYSQGVFQFSGQESWRKSALDAAFDAVMLDDSLAQSYKSLGTAHYVNGHISQSLSANLKAAELNPDYIEAQASLGYIYSERGELKNALERHLKVWQLDKNYQMNWFHLALTLHRLGDVEGAFKWYRQSQKEQPNYHLATYHFSHLLIQTNKSEQALTLLESAAKRSPDSLNVLRGMVDYHLLHDNPEQATPWFHKLALLTSTEGRDFAQLLSLLIEQPDNSELLDKWYHKHDAEYDERPFHSVQLAMAATRLEHHDAAIRHLTEAVELGWLDSYYLNHLPQFNALKSNGKFARLIEFIERKKLNQQQSTGQLKAPTN